MGGILLVLAIMTLSGPRLGNRFREYTRNPGRLPVRNDSRFFRENDDDPRYIRREDDGKP